MADCKNIIIAKTDNEGAVAIIDVEAYVKKAEQQLSSKDVCKKPQHDPTQTHGRLVNDA